MGLKFEKYRLGGYGENLTVELDEQEQLIAELKDILQKGGGGGGSGFYLTEKNESGGVTYRFTAEESEGGGGDADLRVLNVTKNGTYKASENKSGDKISITFNQDYTDVIDIDGMSIIRLNTNIPALTITDGVADYTPLKSGWSYNLTIDGQALPVTPENCEYSFIGAVGVLVDRLPLIVFSPANVKELLIASGASTEEAEFVLAHYPPNTISLLELGAIGLPPYEATFEIGTEVPDPCDGYSEVEVNVKPNLTSLSVTENGTYTIEKTYADSFTYNANTEHNVPEGSIGAFKLDVALPEVDLSTIDMNTGNVDISNFAKDWAFSLTTNGNTIAFNAEELPVTIDDNTTIELKFYEGFPMLMMPSQPLAMLCPSNFEECLRMIMASVGEEVSEEEIQAILSIYPPNTVFLFDLSNLSSDYEATFSYNPVAGKYDGYSVVKVEVPMPAPIPTQEKTLTVTANGTSTVVPDDGYNISKVTVTTNVPIPEPELVELLVSENGTYTPDESIDGYSSVTVDIPSEGIMLNDGFKMSRVVISKDVTSIDNDFSSISPSYTTYIKYDDTMEEWEAIPKIDNWGAGKIDEVRCTDGSIQINGSMLTYVKSSDTDTYYISDCPTDATEVVIPRTYLEKPVTLIAYLAFSDCNLLQNIIVPNSITKINKSAFVDCTSLESVKLPNTITEILADTFRGCTNLTNINIPDSVTSIAANVFKDCTSLENIVIPDSVTSIGYDVFTNCGAKVLENGVYYVDNWIVDVDKTLSSFDFRETVVGIGTGAFKDASITEIVIPEGVKYIGADAFRNCVNLTSVTIPSSLIKLSAHFDNCTALKNVYISNIENWCENIGAWFVYDANLQYSLYLNNELVTNITFPDTVTIINSKAFRGCASITNVTIPSSVHTIGNYSFYQCSGLTDVTISNGVTTISQYAFHSCRNLKNVTLGESISQIKTYAFAYCSSLETIVIPDSVTSIAQYAFRACTSLKTATIGNGLSIIDPYIFGECSGLESITIGTGLTRINNWAFSRCESLKDIYYSGTTAQWNAIIRNSGSSWSSNLSFTVHCTDGDIVITNA
jgi:hypothetical protein